QAPGRAVLRRGGGLRLAPALPHGPGRPRAVIWFFPPPPSAAPPPRPKTYRTPYLPRPIVSQGPGRSDRTRGRVCHRHGGGPARPRPRGRRPSGRRRGRETACDNDRTKGVLGRHSLLRLVEILLPDRIAEHVREDALVAHA